MKKIVCSLIFLGALFSIDQVMENYEDGMPKVIRSYSGNYNLELDKETGYYPNGSNKYQIMYSKGEIRTIKRWDENGKKITSSDDEFEIEPVGNQDNPVAFINNRVDNLKQELRKEQKEGDDKRDKIIRDQADKISSQGAELIELSNNHTRSIATYNEKIQSLNQSLDRVQALIAESDAGDGDDEGERVDSGTIEALKEENGRLKDEIADIEKQFNSYKRSSKKDLMDVKNDLKTNIDEMHRIHNIVDVMADDSNKAAPVKISGEIGSTMTHDGDFVFGDPSVYIDFSGDNWVINTRLVDDEIQVDQAVFASKFRWGVLKFGSQFLPYGIASDFYRPHNNWFVTAPRLPIKSDGIGCHLKLMGYDMNIFIDGEDFVMRWTFKPSKNSEFGISWNSYDFAYTGDGVITDFDDQLFLIDGMAGSDSFDVAYEMNITEDDDYAWIWLRSIYHPRSFRGFGVTFGFFSLGSIDDDPTISWGFGYRADNNLRISTEFLSEGSSDMLLKLSYAF